mgnify:CR=1 FL=1
MKLASSVREAIEGVFSHAVTQGRRMLYEFEVYAVLEALGLAAPQFVFVQDAQEVDETLLQRFQIGRASCRERV